MNVKGTAQNLEIQALSPEQRAAARTLWASLMPAPSPDALMVARQALRQADPEVRRAVTSVMASLWARGGDAAATPNPFE